ncbi:hypothetical protein CTAYLR_010760 [Chrysophaeum taylorii]|uniref:Uncharacterized protein n=1 Tax=Chrysophaeum taylorii TaxID=2483200 RepID=A0AAD7U6W3_9STRA|nr:hypothetical protein CTAYLR_010760 [Chrysophaeum taylorii]
MMSRLDAHSRLSRRILRTHRSDDPVAGLPRGRRQSRDTSRQNAIEDHSSLFFYELVGVTTAALARVPHFVVGACFDDDARVDAKAADAATFAYQTRVRRMVEQGTQRDGGKAGGGRGEDGRKNGTRGGTPYEAADAHKAGERARGKTEEGAVSERRLVGAASRELDERPRGSIAVLSASKSKRLRSFGSRRARNTRAPNTLGTPIAVAVAVSTAPSRENAMAPAVVETLSAQSEVAATWEKPPRLRCASARNQKLGTLCVIILTSNFTFKPLPSRILHLSAIIIKLCMLGVLLALCTTVGVGALRLRPGKKAASPPPPPPPPLTGPILRAAGWTIAETSLLYGALAWAASSGDPDIELVAAFVLVYGAGAVSDVLLSLTASALTAPARQVLIPTKPPDQAWYNTLPKPAWTPPGWVFPIMWLIVSKPAQVIAVARLHSGLMTRPARLAYAAHLALGDTWNRVFFSEKKIGLAAVVIYLYVAVLALAAILFKPLDEPAALLLLPTLAWVLVASTLNLRIYQLSRS